MSHSDYKSLHKGYLDNTFNYKKNFIEDFTITNNAVTVTNLFKKIKKMKDSKLLTDDIKYYLGWQNMVDYISGKASSLTEKENSDYFIFFDDGSVKNIGSINLNPSIQVVPNPTKTNGAVFNISTNNGVKYPPSSRCPNIKGINHCNPLTFNLSPVQKITKEVKELVVGDRVEDTFTKLKGKIVGISSPPIYDDDGNTLPPNSPLIKDFVPTLTIQTDNKTTTQSYASQCIHENYLLNNYKMDAINFNLICTVQTPTTYKYIIDISRSLESSKRADPAKRLYCKIKIEDTTEKIQTARIKIIEVFIFPTSDKTFIDKINKVVI